MPGTDYKRDLQLQEETSELQNKKENLMQQTLGK